MKVIAIKEMGPDSQLVLEERDADPRPEGWSRIAVQAFGVNRADLLQRAGRYPAPRGVAADIPGLEFAGEVIETGNDSRWNVGDPVMGLVSGGGYSTEVICNDGHLLPKPANLSWEEAAGVVEAFLTAWDGMILQGNLSAGGTALIHAAGSGVGVAAVQLAKWTGASVTGTSRTPWKLERLKRDYGIKTVLRKNEWWENTQIDGRCDVVLDLVGGGETSRNVTCLRSQGTVVVVGLTAGVRTEVRLDQL